MHQRRRLDRLTGLLLGHLRRSQFPQLVVHERQELFGGSRVALLDSRQDSRDIGHATSIPPGPNRCQLADRRRRRFPMALR
jgi:hypothetical protein